MLHTYTHPACAMLLKLCAAVHTLTHHAPYACCNNRVAVCAPPLDYSVTTPIVPVYIVTSMTHIPGFIAEVAGSTKAFAHWVRVAPAVVVTGCVLAVAVMAFTYALVNTSAFEVAVWNAGAPALAVALLWAQARRKPAWADPRLTLSPTAAAAASDQVRPAV